MAGDPPIEAVISRYNRANQQGSIAKFMRAGPCG